MAEDEESFRLLQLLAEWREPGPLVSIRSAVVVPDATNREQVKAVQCDGQNRPYRTFPYESGKIDTIFN